MAGREPEETVRLPMARQRWCDIAFLHWAYAPKSVAALLPPGLEPDTRDGQAWVSIRPFQIEEAALGVLPAVPGLSSFGETNVRTYVIGPDGRDGLWFFDIDVGSTWLAAGAQLTLRVPYHRGDQRVVRDANTIRCTGHRYGRPDVGHRIIVETGEPLNLPDDSIVHWLTGRWRGWTRVANRLLSVPVMHERGRWSTRASPSSNRRFSLPPDCLRPAVPHLSRRRRACRPTSGFPRRCVSA